MHEIRCEDKEWFERPGVLTQDELDLVMDTTYADIILRTTDPTLLPRIPENAFKMPGIGNPFKDRSNRKDCRRRAY